MAMPLFPDTPAYATAIRRELHSHPEPPYEEQTTAAILQRELAAVGIPHVGGIAGTGVLAWLMPKDPERANAPAFLFRADMDALPVTEAGERAWRSRREGWSHACGHDGHMAMLLAAARELARRDPPRTLLFLFQPAEEMGGGAERCVAEGVLDGRLGAPAVAAAVGMHNWPGLAEHTVGTRAGTLFASNDRFRIRVKGVGAHGAQPQNGRDPVAALAAVVMALQTIVARNVSPTTPAVVSVTRLAAGSTENVIPAEAEAAGTIRAVDGETREFIRKRIREIAEGTAMALGCGAEVEFLDGYPPVITDNRMAEWGLRELTGMSTVSLAHPEMVAEDFAYYAAAVPSVFFLLGTGNGVMLHSSHFDFPDAVLETGISVWVALGLTKNGPI